MSGEGESLNASAARFGSDDNQLLVGGHTLGDLAARVGQTPFYAYDRRLITQRVAELRDAIPASLHLHYAIKANPMPAVVQLLSGLTDGLDVASAAEMQVALDTGIAPELISFAGPGKTDTELAAAVAAGVIVNMESEGEMRRLAAIGDRQGRRPVVSIRVNPAFELKTSGMKMGGGPKPFGVDEERVPRMLAELAALDLDFRGFHIFGGSQNLRVEAIVESQRSTLELATRLAAHSPVPMRWLNIGGGLGIPYFPGEKPLDLAPIADNLSDLCERAARELPEATLVMELGRYLVAEAGIYVSEVVDRKESRGEVFLVTNGGLHHHLAASGNFGQVIRKNYPVCLGNRLVSPDTERVTVVGPLCTPLDILADKVTLPRAESGDLVVIFQSGAYGYSASPHLFLSHPVPAQVLV
ncbi:pyridoxal-dependent decarboxylase, exosortase A system-associated [Parahaliea mediterranea]|uniref:Pyridoxal-dependent decarboxylase, exosortase A system-associated n=1 Tax=Parahaliea mediterranea TaxID=651086 RepID=A0A939DFP1_9GAMM|nr:pyridoxal-dependent decarboxylase, exosortase A system-associated [Parahaliea mediterranea]MBN7797420.1 pyridoxal-dependent decarboxylase, exosortase A system-associated [Parahaliea mediterranea]